MAMMRDGRYVHTFHQSWVNTYFECPEQARRQLMGVYPPDESSSAAIGTAVHAAIEAVLMDCLNPEAALQVGVDTFRRVSDLPEFRWEKVRTEATALKHVTAAFYSWYMNVFPTLRSTVWVEHRFDFKLCEDTKRVIRISGTVDYGEASGLKDWKTTGNADKYGKRDGWQQTRWAIQPTFYAAAAYEAGLFDHSQTVPFEFVALSPQGREPQRLSADRTWTHVQWLKEQLYSLATLLEARLPVWPLRDQTALCSPKWCLAWDDCKGRYFEDVTGVTKLTTPVLSQVTDQQTQKGQHIDSN